MEVARKYIPKADGIRVRPLGVPALEWRVVVTMWTVVLTLFLKPYISPSQYGARPGVGVAHAWKEIIEQALPADFIYDFDLHGFFNTIRLRPLHRLLEVWAKIPRLINSILFRINAADATPPEEGVHPSDPELAEVDVYALAKSARRGTTNVRISAQCGPGPWPKVTARMADPYYSDDFTSDSIPRPFSWR